MGQWNLWFGWLGVLAGMVVGAVIGLKFADDHWLGGYPSWRRRMVRLGHIAFIGTGLLNITYGLTVQSLQAVSGPGQAAGWLLIAGAIAMPLICFLSAWKPPIRHAFFIPVCCLVGGVGCQIVAMSFKG